MMATAEAGAYRFLAAFKSDAKEMQMGSPAQNPAW
jgi:hypothetical protein